MASTGWLKMGTNGRVGLHMGELGCKWQTLHTHGKNVYTWQRCVQMASFTSCKASPWLFQPMWDIRWYYGGTAWYPSIGEGSRRALYRALRPCRTIQLIRKTAWMRKIERKQNQPAGSAWTCDSQGAKGKACHSTGEAGSFELYRAAILHSWMGQHMFFSKALGGQRLSLRCARTVVNP